MSEKRNLCHMCGEPRTVCSGPHTYGCQERIISKLSSQLAAVNAIIDKLPTDYESNPIGDYTTVFTLAPSGRIYPTTFTLRDKHGEHPSVKTCPMYSTPEAAKAAAEATQEGK